MTSIKTNNLAVLQKLAEQAPENFNAFVNKRMVKKGYGDLELVEYLVKKAPASLDAVIAEAIKESMGSSPKNLDEKSNQILS